MDKLTDKEQQVCSLRAAVQKRCCAYSPPKRSRAYTGTLLLSLTYSLLVATISVKTSQPESNRPLLKLMLPG